MNKICPLVNGGCIEEKCTFWVQYDTVDIRTTYDDSVTHELLYMCGLLQKS
jgi:hypothetical protein